MCVHKEHVFFVLFFLGTLAHERGQVGGGWGTSDQPQLTTKSSKWSATSYRAAAAAEEEEEEEQREHLSSTGEDLSSYEQTSTEQEQRLVDEITAPGGVKIAPPKESLNRFVARYFYLLPTMGADPWNVGLLSSFLQM